MVPPITSLSGIEIYFSGKFVVLETSFGLRVRFNGDHHADVTIPTSYSGQLCGLCGKVISYILTVIVMYLCYFHPSITLPFIMLSCHVFGFNSFGFGRKF